MTVHGGVGASIITHDRGLGSAYERYMFDQRLEEWAERYEIRSALEGPLGRGAGPAP